MPSLILTGYPSAGKTSIAHLLKERALLQPGIESVVIVNEESTCPDWTKQQCYETSLAEKKTRAALKAAFDRAVATSNKQTLVILDSLNYIKGFRYELHCLSKAAGERHGVLWILNQSSVVQEWNDKRRSVKNGKDSENLSYSKDLLDELILRYEPPDERNRWDKPMYTVDNAPIENKNSKSEAVRQSVYNMHSLGDAFKDGSEETSGSMNASSSENSTNVKAKNKPKKSAFSRAKPKPIKLASSTVENPTTAASNITQDTKIDSMRASKTEETRDTMVRKPSKPLPEQLDGILVAFLSSKELKQGASTQQHIAMNVNLLSGVDAVTTRLVSSIIAAQASHTGGKLQISLDNATYAMDLPRMTSLPELRRLRRQYLQWSRTHPPDDTTEKGIIQSFLRYVEEQLK